jgi:hypothetical protein
VGTASVGDCAAQTTHDNENIGMTKAATATRIGSDFPQSKVDLKTTREWGRPDIWCGRMVKLSVSLSE